MRTILRPTLLALLLCVACWGQERPPIELASRAGNLADKHSYYRTLVEEFTGDPCRDKVWVIGLRGVRPDGKRHDSAVNSGAYGDTLVVLRPDGSVEELMAATHAGQERSPDHPFGVAQLRPGQYLAAPLREQPSKPFWQLLTSDGGEALPAWLDRDGNGTISSDEKELDDHYGTKAKKILLCDGLDPGRPRSVGAQTLPPQEFERLVAAVGKREPFHYLLIDANHPVKEQRSDLRTLAHPLSPTDDFAFYERIALKKGVRPNFDLLVVVLRGLAPSGKRHASEDNVGPYNDTFLVLARHNDGSFSTDAFRGSAHAGQASTTRSPGYYAGIAQVRPGLYFARSNHIYHGFWSWHVVRDERDYQGDVPAWRDRDKDGYISVAEKRAAENNGVTADEILIHNGIDGETGNSVGCITMPPAVIADFIELVGEGSSFPLLLLDANGDDAP